MNKPKVKKIDFRRQFEILPEDVVFLEDYGLPWEAIIDQSHWVLLHEFGVPEGYNHQKVSAAIRMETGYPETRLDMVYFFPYLQRNDGKPIGAANHLEPIDSNQWQRWSRHWTDKNPWVPGVHSLADHIFAIEEWLVREFEK